MLRAFTLGVGTEARFLAGTRSEALSREGIHGAGQNQVLANTELTLPIRGGERGKKRRGSQSYRVHIEVICCNFTENVVHLLLVRHCRDHLSKSAVHARHQHVRQVRTAVSGDKGGR